MIRRTFAQIEATARMAERRDTIEFIRERIAEVKAMPGRRVSTDHIMTDDEADQLARRLDAVADGIGAGLHVQ